jgi:hypothetical protein
MICREFALSIHGYQRRRPRLLLCAYLELISHMRLTTQMWRTRVRALDSSFRAAASLVASRVVDVSAHVPLELQVALDSLRPRSRPDYSDFYETVSSLRAANLCTSATMPTAPTVPSATLAKLPDAALIPALEPEDFVASVPAPESGWPNFLAFHLKCHGITLRAMAAHLGILQPHHLSFWLGQVANASLPLALWYQIQCRVSTYIIELRNQQIRKSYPTLPWYVPTFLQGASASAIAAAAAAALRVADALRVKYAKPLASAEDVRFGPLYDLSRLQLRSAFTKQRRASRARGLAAMPRSESKVKRPAGLLKLTELRTVKNTFSLTKQQPQTQVATSMSSMAASAAPLAGAPPAPRSNRKGGSAPRNVAFAPRNVAFAPRIAVPAVQQPIKATLSRTERYNSSLLRASMADSTCDEERSMYAASSHEVAVDADVILHPASSRKRSRPTSVPDSVPTVTAATASCKLCVAVGAACDGGHPCSRCSQKHRGCEYSVAVTLSSVSSRSLPSAGTASLDRAGPVSVKRKRHVEFMEGDKEPVLPSRTKMVASTPIAEALKLQLPEASPDSSDRVDALPRSSSDAPSSVDSLMKPSSDMDVASSSSRSRLRSRGRSTDAATSELFFLA